MEQSPSTISISPVTEISIEYEPSWPWARFFWLGNTFNIIETAFDFDRYNDPYVSLGTLGGDHTVVRVGACGLIRDRR
jgi:hypothetical protein